MLKACAKGLPESIQMEMNAGLFRLRTQRQLNMMLAISSPCLQAGLQHTKCDGWLGLADFSLSPILLSAPPRKGSGNCFTEAILPEQTLWAPRNSCLSTTNVNSRSSDVVEHVGSSAHCPFPKKTCLPSHQGKCSSAYVARSLSYVETDRSFCCRAGFSSMLR